MSEPTYRIKPLVWITASQSRNFVRTVIGTYEVSDRGGEVYWYLAGINRGQSNSLKAAKAACEQHYRERMMEVLEVVK